MFRRKLCFHNVFSIVFIIRLFSICTRCMSITGPKETTLAGCVIGCSEITETQLGCEKPVEPTLLWGQDDHLLQYKEEMSGIADIRSDIESCECEMNVK